MNLLDLFARITLDTSNYDNGLDGASKKADSFGSKLKSGLTAAGKAAVAGMAAATTAVGAFAAASIKTGASFDSSMSQVAATMGTTVDQIQNLRDFAMDMGAKTAFSATEAADALNYMALAGYSADESMQALPNVLNLAAAGGIDLASASDMVTDAQSALGLSMEESAELVDKMAMASSKSNTSVAQLGEAILTVGGTAKTLAGGTTELSTALGILADNGVKGAEGGTALRNIILSLSAPTDTAAKAMESLKLEAFDANGNLRPLNETFSDLNAALSEMTQGEQTQVLNSIFNKVDLKSVNALLANTGERFDELSGYIDEASGAAEKMANTQLDNLTGDITLMQSAIEGLQIALSDKLSPSIREVIQGFTDIVGKATEFVGNGGLEGILDKINELLPAIASLTGAFVSFKASMAIEGAIKGFRHAQMAISVLSANLNGASLAQAALNGTMTAGQTVVALLTGQMSLAELAQAGMTAAQTALNAALNANPIAIVITAIGALVAALVTLYATNEDFRNKVNEIWESVKLVIGSVAESIVGFFTETIPNAFYSVIEFFTTTVPEAIENFVNSVGNFFTITIPQFFESFVQWFEELPNKIAYWLGFAIGKLIAWGDEALDWVTTTVPEIIGNIVDFFSELPDKIWEWLSETVENISRWVENAKGKALEVGTKVIDTIVNFFSELPSKIWNFLLESLNKISGFITDMGETFKTEAPKKIDEFIGFFEELPDRIFDIGGNIVSGLWNGINEKWDNLKSKVFGLFDDLVAGVQNGLGINSPSKVFRDEVGQYIALGVAEGIADKTSEAVKAADNLAKDVYSRSKDWADKNTKYMALSLEEQAELWETIQSQFIKGSKQYSDAEEKIFDLRAKAQEEYQKEAEASQKKYLDSATKVLEAFKKKGQEILKENEDLQKQYQDTLAKRTSEIFNSFGLFDEIPEREEKSGTKLIENLQGQIDSIQSFYDSLTELEERGAASALVDEIRGMGVGAADELAALLSLTDDQLSEYSNLYGEKQELANSIALEELEGLRVETENKIQENLDSLKNLYIELAPGVGTAFADGLAQGILNGLVTVADAAEQVAKAAIEASMKALDEHSPSKLAEKIGLNFDKGLSNGLLSGEDMISRDVNRILDFGTANVDFASSGLGMSSAAIVNSAAVGGLGASGPISLNIPVMLPDGTVIARAMISDLIKVASAAGTPIVSTGYA